MNVGIIDYGMGNLGSIKRSLDLIGVSSIISDKPKVLSGIDKLILPGVGHFGNAVKQLNEKNLFDFIREMVEIKKVPILGICLGMQLMAKFSEEGNMNGLGWIDATVVKFDIKDTLRYKIPHIGWHKLIKNEDSALVKDINPMDEFYFVHSYHMKVNSNKVVIAESKYEEIFTSAISSNNVFGVQFHPEKSHSQGDLLLRNFLKI